MPQCSGDVKTETVLAGTSRKRRVFELTDEIIDSRKQGKQNMKKKLTALLLSALVLPGLGQLYLGRKIAGGIILVLVNLVLLLALFVLLRGLSPVIASRIAGGAVSIYSIRGDGGA